MIWLCGGLSREAIITAFKKSILCLTVHPYWCIFESKLYYKASFLFYGTKTMLKLVIKNLTVQGWRWR
jgi:hypothetical protein